MIGIGSLYKTVLDQTVSSSVLLQNIIGLTFPVAAGRSIRFTAWIPILEVGNVAGIKLFASLPANSYNVIEYRIINCVVIPFIGVEYILRNANAAQVGTLGNAGNHIATIKGNFLATASGDLRIQFAQSISDPAATTIMRGACLEIIVES